MEVNSNPRYYETAEVNQAIASGPRSIAGPVYALESPHFVIHYDRGFKETRTHDMYSEQKYNVNQEGSHIALMQAWLRQLEELPFNLSLITTRLEQCVKGDWRDSCLSVILNAYQ